MIHNNVLKLTPDPSHEQEGNEDSGRTQSKASDLSVCQSLCGGFRKQGTLVGGGGGVKGILAYFGGRKGGTLFWENPLKKMNLLPYLSFHLGPLGLLQHGVGSIWRRGVRERIKPQRKTKQHTGITQKNPRTRNASKTIPRTRNATSAQHVPCRCNGKS